MAAIEREATSSRRKPLRRRSQGVDLQKEVQLLQLEKVDIEATLNLTCKSQMRHLQLEGEMA